MSSPPSPRLYGRRKGRPLRTRKAELIKTLLPKLTITLPDNKGDGASRQTLVLDRLFSFKPEQIWLEIGFGGGEHLAAQAQKHPDVGFIGCEPFVNGVAGLCNHIDKNALGNIRIFPNDARLLLDALPDAVISRCFILFPDPWPKARHTERRFIGGENLPRLARVMKSGAELRMATDAAPLAEWIRLSLKETSAFKMLRDSPEPPKDWVATRYEQKGRKAGRQPAYIEWKRL